MLHVVIHAIRAAAEEKRRQMLRQRQAEADRLAALMRTQAFAPSVPPSTAALGRGGSPPRPAPAPTRSIATAPPTQSASSSRSRPAVAAPAIARWANPNTLRSQFILTEILKPPLSTRPPSKR